jgi:hypothetical protein
LRLSSLLRAALVVACTAASCPAACLAARPFVTDDARIVDTGGCQIESFYKRQHRQAEEEFWFLPACTPKGPVELTLGGLKLDNANEGTSSAAIAQAKTLLRELRPNDFGLALTLGAARVNTVDPALARGWSPYLNAIASLSLPQDRAVIHANLGSIRDRTISRTRLTWGIGAEIPIGGRLFGIVETYGQDGDRPSQQIGLRYWVVPNRFQVDGTLGAQSCEPRTRTWTSLGIRVLF